MLKNFGLFHILPFALGIILFVITYQLFILNFIDYYVAKNAPSKIIVKGKQEKLNGVYANLIDSLYVQELNFIASIKNKKQLTLLGSSEFSESPYVTYNFLTSKKNYQIMGLGHAHHQSLSILIELLAAHQENKASKVVFFISPGWFVANGTNSEAFIEFARPNFLKRIIKNNAININYKTYLGKFINQHYNEFDGHSNSLSFFNKLYTNSTFNRFIKQKFTGSIQTPYIPNVNYYPELSYTIPEHKTINYDSIASVLQDEFISTIKSNSIYVYDEYYTQYLIDSNGVERFVILDELDIPSNQEYQDFKLLVDYVSEREMEASFIIIPYNPYYYRNTEIYLPLIDSLTTLLDNKNLPYKNMYVSDTLQYEPGILKDVMHFGNYGWMKVNKYIDSLYYGNNH